jgi:hypothetical protein
MASIFTSVASVHGLRLRYSKLAFGSLAAATTPATAVQLTTMLGGGSFGFFQNKLNTDVAILACHPDDDPTIVTNLLLLFEMSAGDMLNFEDALGQTQFDPNTKLFLYYLGALAPTSGVFRVVWG